MKVFLPGLLVFISLFYGCAAAPVSSVNASDPSINTTNKSMNAKDNSVNARDQSMNSLILEFQFGILLSTRRRRELSTCT